MRCRVVNSRFKIEVGSRVVFFPLHTAQLSAADIDTAVWMICDFEPFRPQIVQFILNYNNRGECTPSPDPYHLAYCESCREKAAKPTKWEYY